MTLYIGSSGPQKVSLSDGVYNVYLFSNATIIDGVMLLSSDNYRLMDSKGVYLTAKESE